MSTHTVHTCPHTCSHLQVQFDGRDVDFTKDSDGYRSWITAINLNFNNTQSAGVVSVGGKAVLSWWYQCVGGQVLLHHGLDIEQESRLQVTTCNAKTHCVLVVKQLKRVMRLECLPVLHCSPACASAHSCLPAGHPGRAGHMAARADLQHQRRHLAAVRVQLQGAVPGQRQRAVPVLPARRHRAAGQRLPYDPALKRGLHYVPAHTCSGGGYWQLPCGSEQWLSFNAALKQIGSGGYRQPCSVGGGGYRQPCGTR